jgi:pimeloyl-ACP methyl ester carboxylesterase
VTVTVPMTEGASQMGPVVLPFDLHGSGDVRVVMIHGWFADRTTFQAVTPYLDTETFTYAVPDLRGYGEARLTQGEYSMAEIAGDTVALADHLGWDRFSVVGHSMGGKAAQLVAGLAAERVRRIVGISPVPASGTGFDPATAAHFARAADDPAVRRAILDHSTGRQLPGRWLDAMVQRSLDLSARDAFAAYLPRWSGDDLHEHVVGSRVPALAVVGGRDPDLNADVMRQTWAQWFTHAEVRELPDAGHYAMDEAPLALVSIMEGFLSAPDVT